MGRFFGWLFAAALILAMAYFVIAGTNPELANDIINFLTQE